MRTILEKVYAWDVKILFFVYKKIKNRLFDYFIPTISQLGDKAIIWFLFIAFFFFYVDGIGKKVAVALGIELFFCGFFVELCIKRFYKRKRPFQVFEGLDVPLYTKSLLKRASFPSGHSAGFFGGAVVITYFYPQTTIGMYIFACVGAFSRTYCTVHYPSDVFVGSIIGYVCGILSLVIVKKIL